MTLIRLILGWIDCSCNLSIWIPLMNILFVCSRNQWRSRTAEALFKNSHEHQVRSAGTEREARIRVTEKMILWADLIFVMEKRHKERLADRFGELMDKRELIILDIEDKYRYMAPDLIEALKHGARPYF